MSDYSFDPEHPFTYVPPLEGESIASFLHRFRSAPSNRISSPAALGKILGIGTAINRWEKFFFGGRTPAQEEIEALSTVTRVDAYRLWQMFPPEGERSQPNVVRLCATCYQEGAYHQIAWQLRSVKGCDRHQLRLLSKCPQCKKPFPIPALWAEGKCKNCSLPFAKMAKFQKPL